MVFLVLSIFLVFRAPVPVHGAMESPGQVEQEAMEDSPVPLAGDGEGEDGMAGDDGEEPEKAGNGFLDAMLDSVFGAVGDGQEGRFSVYGMLDESAGIVDAAFREMTDPATDMGTFYYLLKAVGLAVMTLYFIMGLASRDVTRQFGRPTVEMLAMPFAKFIICLFILSCSEWIMEFFLYLSQWCFNRAPRANPMVGTLGETVGDYKKLVYDAVGYTLPSDKSGLGIVDTFRNTLPFFSVFMAFMVPWLVSLATDLASVWVVYSRTAQIIIMAAGAPLAMADLYGEHPLRETRAFGYIREFAGLCFQSVVIALVFLAMDMVMAVFLEHFSGQASGGMGSIGELMTMGLKIAVFRLVQVGLVVGSANRAKKVMASV